MERRKEPDRRQTHMFVSNERRTGPFDRRGADMRRLEREEEIRKIEKLRAYRQKDSTPPPAAPLLTRKRLVYIGIALVLILFAALMAT